MKSRKSNIDLGTCPQSLVRPGGIVAKYIVAGVTGRVGSAVATHLLSRGADTTVIVRNEQAGTKWANLGASIAVGSLDDDAFLTTLFQGAGAAFVLLPENVDPQNFHAVRRRMADAIARA